MTDKTEFVSANTINGTVANGGTTADFDLSNKVICGYQLPTMTSTTVTYSMSYDNSTWVPMYKTNVAMGDTIASSRYIVLNPSDFWGVRYLRMTFGSAEGAARTIRAQCVAR